MARCCQLGTSPRACGWEAYLPLYHNRRSGARHQPLATERRKRQGCGVVYLHNAPICTLAIPISIASGTYRRLVPHLQPTTASTFALACCDDFCHRRAKLYLTYCKRAFGKPQSGKSAQQARANAYFFRRSVACIGNSSAGPLTLVNKLRHSFSSGCTTRARRLFHLVKVKTPRQCVGTSWCANVVSRLRSER